MADQFKPGDTVILKSGGPMMTVTEVEGTRVFCEWFDAKNNPQSRSFEQAALRHAKAD